MEADVIAQARAGDEAAFQILIDPYRRELLLHCYRILGSMHDAEDALQETLLAGWSGLGGFEGRSSIRTWLYRIATNRCLNMRRAEARRPKHTDEMADVELPEPTRLGEVLWLEPYPDHLLDGIADHAPGPEAIYETSEAVSLAFVTALQLLPPRQRAALILRDVLGYHAAEVASILDSSEESVTSALKRARATLHDRLAEGAANQAPTPRSEPERRLVERFTRAFEARDLVGVVNLLTEDVWFKMPPLPMEWQGKQNAHKFLQAVSPGPGIGRRLLSTRANGQPALAMYIEEPNANILHLVGMLVLTLDGDRIAAITRFDHGVLDRFDVPRTLGLHGT